MGEARGRTGKQQPDPVLPKYLQIHIFTNKPMGHLPPGQVKGRGTPPGFAPKARIWLQNGACGTLPDLLLPLP